MQILKTNTVSSTPDTSRATTSNGVDSSSSTSDLQSGINDFFNADYPAPETTAPISDQSMDFLFPTTRGNASSGDPFSPDNVVTLEEYLMEHPEGRFYLDQFIKKMETVRDKILVPNKENLEKALSQGGMSASEASKVQAQIADLVGAINKVNGEIAKAEQLQTQQNANYEQELLYMQDLNGDGYIGDHNDKDKSYIVAKHPVTGQEVFLDPKTMQPAIDPYTDLKYKPALIGADRVSLLTREQADQSPGVDESKMEYDVALQLKEPSSSAFPDSLGAQIDFSAGEGFWVEKDPETGKAAFNGEPKEGTASNYKLKEFKIVKREDGKEMIGQEPPTAEERGKYIFIRTTDLNIRSTQASYKGQEFDAAGNVYLEYTNGTNIVATFCVEGYQSKTNPPSSLACTGTDYVAATSVGVAVNSGKLADGNPTLHSARIRPMHIDASGLELTSRILAANPGDPAHPNANFSDEVANFYKKLGIPPNYNGATGEFSGDPKASDTDRERSGNAANDTFMNGFLSTAPKIYGGGGSSTGNWDQDMQDAAKEIKTKFDATHAQGVYLSGDHKYDEFKRGILIDGIRGNITGTDYNDIVIVPAPDQDAIKKLLPIGAKDITPDSAAYKTVVHGNGGHNIMISKGGDFYGTEVNFFWQTDEGKFKDDEQIRLVTNNSANSNHGIFVHIDKAGHKKSVSINNGDDSDLNDGVSKEGHKDDYFYGPNTMEFAKAQNDIPGGIRSTHINKDAAADIDKAISDASEKIDHDVIHQDPLAVVGDPAKIEWEYGQFYKDVAAKLDGFFAEYSLFNLKNGTSESTEGVLK